MTTDDWRPVSEYDRHRDGWVLCGKYGGVRAHVGHGTAEPDSWWVNVCMSAMERPDVWMPVPVPPEMPT